MAENASKTAKKVAAKDKTNPPAPAEGFVPSGAPDQVVGVDPSHPAVDNDPRARTGADQNRIDMNDPTISGEEAVRRNLADGPKASKD